MLASTANNTRLSATGCAGIEVALTDLSGTASARFRTQFLANDLPQYVFRVCVFLRLPQGLVNHGLIEALAGLNAGLGAIR